MSPIVPLPSGGSRSYKSQTINDEKVTIAMTTTGKTGIRMLKWCHEAIIHDDFRPIVKKADPWYGCVERNCIATDRNLNLSKPFYMRPLTPLSKLIFLKVTSQQTFIEIELIIKLDNICYRICMIISFHHKTCYCNMS